MTETDSRMAYSAAFGLALGVLAYNLHWVSGAGFLAFAAMPAAALVGFYLLESWRDAAGRERIEPLVSFGIIVVFSAAIFGWFFARSSWVSQFSALMGASLLIPILIAWFLDRKTLKGDIDPSLSESSSGVEPY